jgi:membrane protein
MLPRVKSISPRMAWDLLLETFSAWSRHKGQKMGAALSYYTAFSLAPVVTLVFSVASLLLKENAKQDIVNEFNNLIGAQAGQVAQDILNHAADRHTASWGTVISFVILVFSASGAFGELQDSLNQIWDVSPERRPFLVMLKERALSFVMVFVLGFFIMVSLLLSVALAALGKWVFGQFPAAWLELANTIISSAIFTILFAVIFRLLPEVTVHWRDVWAGAMFSTILFIIGKLLLGFYIGHSASFSTYGAAGSFVIILLWVFYSAQILYLGAEFTRCYAQRYGSRRAMTSAPEPATR